MRLKLVLSVLSRDLNGRRGGGDRRMWIEEAILPDGMVTLSTLIPCHNTAAECRTARHPKRWAFASIVKSSTRHPRSDPGTGGTSSIWN